MTESWKPIILNNLHYPYEISTAGRVKNLKGHILKPYKRGSHKGVYHCVKLCKKGKKVQIDIQRLVALHFIPNPLDKPEVNHKNLNRYDNRVQNLEWVTRQENMMHRVFMRGCLRIEKQIRKYGVAI